LPNRTAFVGLYVSDDLSQGAEKFRNGLPIILRLLIGEACHFETFYRLSAVRGLKLALSNKPNRLRFVRALDVWQSELLERCVLVTQ
jgi:hypothetical protein